MYIKYVYDRFTILLDLFIFKLVLNYRLIYSLLLLFSVYVQKYFLVIDVIRIS